MSAAADLGRGVGEGATVAAVARAVEQTVASVEMVAVAGRQEVATDKVGMEAYQGSHPAS